MRREVKFRRAFRFVSGVSLILFLTLLISSKTPFNQKVEAQSSQCPPIIMTASASLLTLDALNVSIRADDCDGNTVKAEFRLLNGRNIEVANSTTVLNPPPPPRGPFDVSVLITGLSSFLGSCTIEAVLIDSNNNRSTPRQINFRSCTQPLIGQFRVDPINGDKIRASIRGGDPDLNTNQVIFEIRNGSGSILRGPDTIDSSAITEGLGDFLIFLESEGISLLNNPSIVKVQLKDARGNLSEPAEAQFSAIKGQPDLASTLILDTNTFCSGFAN